ncbi:MAG: hypothetical protein ACPGLV_05180 [Bacteroidia bacterium]
MIIAITEFRLKRFKYYYKALKLATKAGIEAKEAKGFIYMKTGGKGFMTLRTLSAWETINHMNEFVKMPAHLEAMKMAPLIAKSTNTMHIELDEIPKWNDAFKMLSTKKR